jgi:hypothetical protein
MWARGTICAHDHERLLNTSWKPSQRSLHYKRWLNHRLHDFVGTYQKAILLFLLITTPWAIIAAPRTTAAPWTKSPTAGGALRYWKHGVNLALD